MGTIEAEWLVDFSMSYKCKRSEDFPMSNVGIFCFSKEKKKRQQKNSKNHGKNWFRTLRKFIAYALRPDRTQHFEQGIQPNEPKVSSRNSPIFMLILRPVLSSVARFS